MARHIQDTTLQGVQASIKDAANAEIEKTFSAQSDLWFKLIRLTGNIPVETELFLSVLCPILINHYMAARQTQETINFLLEAAQGTC